MNYPLLILLSWKTEKKLKRNMTRNVNFESVIEQTEQELGLEPTAQQREDALLKFRDLPYWIWDPKEHERIYLKTYGEVIKDQPHCCYNHTLGLPVKDGVPRPLYPYQRPFLDALERDKFVACHKPRSAGITEVALRYLEHLILRDESFKGMQAIIISAAAEAQTISFIQRMKAHLEPHFGSFDSRETILKLGDVTVRTMPPHNLRRIRGLTDVFYCLAEEADHWNKSEEDELLPIIMPLRQKYTDMRFALVSTPGRLGGLMQSLHDGNAERFGFKNVVIDWRDVELYSDQDIRRFQSQPNWQREFALQWGYGTGTLFSYPDLQYAVELGRRYADVKYNPDHAKRPYPYCIYPEADTMLGIDTAGGSTSEFGIVGLQIWNRHVHIFAAESYSRPNFDQMIDRVMELWQGTSCNAKIYVDSSNPGWIRLLKARMSPLTGGRERVDFENYIQHLREKGHAGDHDMKLSDFMSVVPVVFSTHAPRLLQAAAFYVQRHLVAIHPDFKLLIEDLHSARTKEHASNDWQLDKSQHSHDILDAFRCAMYDFRVERPKIPITAY
jgi:hypothetical protein